MARKTCRKRAKDAARAEGVQPSSALQLARMGQNRAAAKDWSACLSTLAKVTDDTTCAAVAKEALANMSGLKNGDQQLREEIEALKATHDASKLGQIKQLEQYDAQVRSELNKLHEGHAAIHDHLGRQADEHSSAMESGLQNFDAQLRAKIEALKATHDSTKADQIVALEQYEARGADQIA